MDPRTCPLCGKPNQCGMAEGKGSCWCFEVKLDPAALAKLPEEAKGKACVCRSCGVAREERPADGTKP